MKQRIETPYGKASVYSAENTSPDAEYAIVVPGFSEGSLHSQDLVDALAAKGFNALAFSQPRRAGKGAHKVKDPVRRQANILMSVLEKSVPDGERVHAVAHSMGSTVLKAAIEHPERFASITLMQPLGMAGEQSLPELVTRVTKKTVKNHVRALRGQRPTTHTKEGYAARIDDESAFRYFGRVALAHLDAGRFLASQPILAVKEALAAGKHDIKEDIEQVTELGIPVHLVAAHNDEMFDRDKVQATYEAGSAATSYSMVADRDAAHDTSWMQPERTAEIVSQLHKQK